MMTGFERWKFYSDQILVINPCHVRLLDKAALVSYIAMLQAQVLTNAPLMEIWYLRCSCYICSEGATVLMHHLIVLSSLIVVNRCSSPLADLFVFPLLTLSLALAFLDLMDLNLTLEHSVCPAVTSKHYTIEARKEHYKFKKLEKYMVLPNMASIEDINAISYDICGSVRMVGAGLKAKVALTHGPENVKPQRKLTDGNGNFCFEVLPGEYRLSAIAASPENAPGLMFLPSYIDVVVKSPLMNVKFSQALVNIHGVVACKEKCGPSVSVTLVNYVVFMKQMSQFMLVLTLFFNNYYSHFGATI